MPTTLLDGETYAQALARRHAEEAATDARIAARQHTPGPWSVESDGLSITMAGQVVASSIGPDYAGNEEKKANARRIVACVNACEGISTEDLQIIDDAGETLKFCFGRLKEQRDELIAALERLALAAFRRDLSTGDPFTMIEAKDELVAANKNACAVMREVKGKRG